MEENEKLIKSIIESEELSKYLKELHKIQTQEILKEINKTNKKTNKKNKVSTKDSDELLNKIQEYKSMSESYKNQYNLKEAEVTQLIEEKEVLKQQLEQELVLKHRLEQEINVLNKKTMEYENKYGLIDQAFLQYIDLPESIKQRISNIIREDDIYSFIVAICNWQNIYEIWNFIKRRIIESELDGIDCLKEMFRLSFQVFCIYGGDGKYELIDPVLGERFDSDRHGIIGNETDGIITEVLLSGIKDCTKNKTLCKSLIRIK